jgi:hypothetical protein
MMPAKKPKPTPSMEAVEGVEVSAHQPQVKEEEIPTVKPEVIEPEVIDYKPITSFKNLNELINKVFIIKSIRQEPRRFSDREAILSIIELDNGEQYYSFSSIVAKQLQELKQYIDAGKRVRVKLIKRKRYLTFTSPEQ